MTQVTPITGRRHCLKPTTSVRCFYTNLHLRIKNFCAPEHLNVTVRLNEVKFKGKLYYVVKFDRPDPERGIPDKRDKLLCKNSVPNKNRPESEASGYLASGYLRLHCIKQYLNLKGLTFLNRTIIFNFHHFTISYM